MDITADTFRNKLPEAEQIRVKVLAVLSNAFNITRERKKKKEPTLARDKDITVLPENKERCAFVINTIDFDTKILHR